MFQTFFFSLKQTCLAGSVRLFSAVQLNYSVGSTFGQN